MEMHKTQIGILNKLLFFTEAKYTDLKIDPQIGNNTFQFHLNKVIESGLVIKNSNGNYSLTKYGKKIANQINTDQNRLIDRRKISVHLYCIRYLDANPEVLMYTRAKHPFFGKQGFPTGKVLLGENFYDSAKRELKEEMNLEGEPKLFNIIHWIVREEKTKELLDDKVFLDFFIKDPVGNLKGSNEGEYLWIPIAELNRFILKPFNTIEVYENAIKRIMNFNGSISFDEFEQLTNDF